MEVHVFILSTMSPETTSIYLNAQHLEYEYTDSIQRFQWKRQNNAGISVTVWVACQSPLINELIENTLTHMDACICLYHDHDALSCLKMRKAMQRLEMYNENIFPMMTTTPQLLNKHKSRVQKFYNKDGFERERFTGTLTNTIERLLRTNLDVFKSLRRL